MKLNHWAAIRLTGLILTVLLLGACASQGPFVRYHGDLTLIESVVVVPFENVAEFYESGTGVRSPISGRDFRDGPCAVGADRFLTGQLVSHVQRDTAFEILPPGEPAAVPEAVVDSSGAKGTAGATFAKGKAAGGRRGLCRSCLPFSGACRWRAFGPVARFGRI
jgi:hypothetical protein